MKVTNYVDWRHQIDGLGLIHQANLVHSFVYVLIALTSLLIQYSCTRAAAPLSWRINERDFPSIFQAWEDAQVHGEDTTIVRARHDLIWTVSHLYGLRWNGPTAGQSDVLEEDSIQSALRYRQQLLKINPHLVLLSAEPYYQAESSWLPPNHHWWRRNEQMARIEGWQGGREKYYLLDYMDEELRGHIARRAGALVRSGVVDGIMLDLYYIEDPSRLDLLRRVRDAIGPDKLIIVNSNGKRLVHSASYINGLYMEVDPHSPTGVPSRFRTPAPSRWRQIIATLQWAEVELLEPRINCLETWCQYGRDETRNMRMTTTATLTLSNGYSLFCDPNYLPGFDHAHDWYDFWNTNLGRPIQSQQTDEDRRNGGFVRIFTKGIAAFNPPFNDQEMRLVFEKPVRRVSTGKISDSFTVRIGDGDIFQFIRPEGPRSNGVRRK